MFLDKRNDAQFQENVVDNLVFGCVDRFSMSNLIDVLWGGSSILGNLFVQMRLLGIGIAAEFQSSEILN